MTITRVSRDFKIPYDEDALLSGDPARVAAYMLEFAETVELLLSELNDVSNLSVALADGGAAYYSLPDEDGNYPIGTWRTIQVGTNLEHQVQLTLNVWTSAKTTERPV